MELKDARDWSEHGRKSGGAPSIASRILHWRIPSLFQFPASRTLVLLSLMLYGAFMVATNHRLTILDDEGTIVTAANQPASAAIGAFLHRAGQHEHPPLSDVVLHAWLVATRHSFAWMRVFANIFYVAGLVALAACGRKLAGARGYWAVLLLGMLWPFGYFYARIAGWYCFCFFFVALLTYSYLGLVEKPSIQRWAAFTSIGIALLWSNYFGVAFLLLLLADLVLYHRAVLRASIPALLVSIFLMVVTFLPLLHALMIDARGTVKPAATPLTADLLKIGYTLFSLLASVAVAPWFLPWSVIIGVAGSVLAVLMLLTPQARRFAGYFLLLIVALCLSSHLDLKRLLFLSPWLILAAAIVCSRVPDPRGYAAIAAVSASFLVGWIGIATGRHPATVNFYEPWKQVAASTSAEIHEGDIIISNSTPYFFYLNDALGMASLASHRTYLGVDAYGRRGFKVFADSFPENYHPAGLVTLVEGVDTTERLEMLAKTAGALEQNCRLLGSEKAVPDPAIAYKQLLGADVPLVAYRVRVEHYDCPGTPR